MTPRGAMGRAWQALLLLGAGAWAGFALQQAFPPANPGGFHIAIAKDQARPLSVHFLPDPDLHAPPKDAPATEDAPAPPFPVRLLESRQPAPPPGAPVILSAQEGAHTEHVAVRPGEEAVIGGERYVMRSPAPWTGLVAAAQGIPMAHVTVLDAEAPDGRHIFLPEGQWTSLQPGVKATLRQHDDEPAAREAAAAPQLDGRGARWGVVEDETTHWFNSFQPRTGLELDDGRQVVLAEILEDGAALRVAVLGPEGVGELRVAANDPDDAALVRFEHPAALNAAVVLHAGAPEGVFASLFRSGRLVAQAFLGIGERWNPEGLDSTVVLSGLGTRVVPVYPQAGGPMGVVLESEQRRLFVGEVQPLQAGDVALRFESFGEVPPWQYLVAIGDGPARTVHVGERVRQDGWELTALPPSGFSGEVAEFMLIRGPVPLERTLGWFALATAVCAAAGLVARMTTGGVRRQRSKLSSGYNADNGKELP